MIAGAHQPRRPSTGASSQSRTILSIRDLSKLRARASALGEQPSNLALERKNRLKKLSEEHTTKFPDTLNAMRERKQNFIRDKKQREEDARKEIDRQEAEYQKKLRSDIIKKAEQAFFNQTDRMKLMASKQAIAETIFERQKQVAEKTAREEKGKAEAAKYHELIMEKVRLGDLEEKEKEEQRKLKIAEIAQARKMQLEEVQKQREKEAAEAHAIGVASRARAQELVAEEEQAQIEKQRRVEKMNEDMILANEKNLEIRHHLEEAEAREAAKLDREVEKVRSRKNAQKSREIGMREEKQKQRDRLIEVAIQRLSMAQKGADERLSNQIAEKQAAEDAVAEAKKNKAEKIKREIDESRHEMIQNRFSQYLRDQEENKELLKVSKVKWAAALQEEQDKERARKEENDRIKLMQKEEGVMKARRKVQDRVDSIAREKLVLAQLGEREDNRFKEAVVSQIESNVERGMITHPLLPLLELEAVRLLPARRKSGPLIN